MSKALRPLSKRNFLKKLKKFGIIELPDRGHGGEFIVGRESTGPSLTLPHLGSGDDVLVCYIKQTLRRFNIDRDKWISA